MGQINKTLVQLNAIFAELFSSASGVGIGEVNPAAALHIKGKTSDTSAYAFKAAKADGTNFWQIRNDGLSLFDGTFIVNNAKTASNDFIVRGDNDSLLLYVDVSYDKVGIGAAPTLGILTIKNSNTYIDRDESGNLTFTDAVAGTKTLKQCAPTEVYNEVPAGTLNGTNTDFTLANTPTAGTARVYLNGLRQAPTTDYSVTGAVITFVVAPQASDVILVDYKH